ncbi:MAG TPA: substrate-binding domain-containing protein [Methylomirabilota bacterium]|nr:substrate-binding domain-containing protein [Methylomirabilota bacterium]
MTPASPTGRRRRPSRARAALHLLLLAAIWPATLPAAERRYTIAFANLTEEPGVALEGTGFTGPEVRESFVLAARNLPVELVFYDNQRDGGKALANAADAIARKVDLYIQYHQDPAANLAVAEKLRAAGIPVLAVNYPVPGAPLYTADNLEAGRIAGEALGRFATSQWPGQAVAAALLGNLADQGHRLHERAQGVREGLRRHLPAVRVAALDTQGNAGQVAILLGKFMAGQPTGKLLVAVMDDATALAAKGPLEAAGRLQDAAIVSQGVDRSIHGGVSERKEIDPYNRGSIVIGSVAFYLDRYGYDILPLALRVLRGEKVPPRTTTRHLLVTAANVWREYPPRDMN